MSDHSREDLAIVLLSSCSEQETASDSYDEYSDESFHPDSEGEKSSDSSEKGNHCKNVDPRFLGECLKSMQIYGCKPSSRKLAAPTGVNLTAKDHLRMSNADSDRESANFEDEEDCDSSVITCDGNGDQDENSENEDEENHNPCDDEKESQNTDECLIYKQITSLLEGGKTLEDLRINDLKVYLRQNNLRLSGSKVDCIMRIKEHWRLRAGSGKIFYPRSSFSINCKGDVCRGDVVLFTQNTKKLGKMKTHDTDNWRRTVAGRVVKESYGAEKQQHTFTIEVLWTKGAKELPPLYPLLVKGRNLYKLITRRQPWEDEKKRAEILAEKHIRGAAARHLRATKISNQVAGKKHLSRLRKHEMKRKSESKKTLVDHKIDPFHQSKEDPKPALPRRHHEATSHAHAPSLHAHYLPSIKFHTQDQQLLPHRYHNRSDPNAGIFLPRPFTGGIPMAPYSQHHRPRDGSVIHYNHHPLYANIRGALGQQFLQPPPDTHRRQRGSYAPSFY